jgi:hypothetical protein
MNGGENAMTSGKENNDKLSRLFVAKLQKSAAKGGWTFVVWPESVHFFGTRGLVKVRGKIDGHPIRRAIHKSAGDTVQVLLEERLRNGRRNQLRPHSPAHVFLEATKPYAKNHSSSVVR